jgi:YHS domain-containing protein
MKTKILMLAVLLTAILFTINNTYAQNEDCKSKCEKTCSNEEKSKCESKSGNSQGTLDSGLVCPVSGEKIDGGEGTPVKYTYLGKEYTFCCAGCVAKFKAEPLNYIKTELTCPVMGEPAKKDVFTVVDGVKYYFCCEGCIAKFEKNPAKYLNK